MTLKFRVLPDPNADLPELAFRAYAIGTGLGLVDAAGPTPAQACERAARRWRLRWLGVEWPGIATPDEALNPIAGQVAINGHRFALWRQLSAHRERLIHWILLNPSTAGASADDATMRRVRDFSHRWGFGWVTVGNLWSYRATFQLDPLTRDIVTDTDGKPVVITLTRWLDRGGEWVTRANADCMRWVEGMARRADLVVVAWGAQGQKDRRGLTMLRHLDRLGIEPHALAVTRTGEPAHPLRLSASLTPRPLAELRGSGQ